MSINRSIARQLSSDWASSDLQSFAWPISGKLLPGCLLVVIASFASSVTAEAIAEEKAVQGEFDRVGQAIEKGDSEQAVKLLDELIEEDSELSAAMYLRGRENFKLNRIDQSVEDFERYIKLRPDHASRQWERGISLYYAKKFKEGADQFALYQTFHDSDVENSVWRYLCMARAENVEKAREQMLEIKNDSRVPMMEIYEMYRGNLEPEKVLAAAKADDSDEQQLNRQLFYAHLYLGLFYDAAENPKLAREHIEKAVKHKIGHYMWNVADVHLKRMNDAKSQ